MTLEEGASDASALVQSILKKNPENQKDPKDPKDGAPTSPPPQLPKDLLSDYSGQGPRLQDKLAAMVPKELEESTLKLMDEAKTDTNAQAELRDMVMDITGTVPTLWIPKRMALVQVGHTPFKYISKARDKDPYHRHTIIFMGDRDKNGDPTPFAMSPDKAEECGT